MICALLKRPDNTRRPPHSGTSKDAEAAAPRGETGGGGGDYLPRMSFLPFLPFPLYCCFRMSMVSGGR